MLSSFDLFTKPLKSLNNAQYAYSFCVSSRACLCCIFTGRPSPLPQQDETLPTMASSTAGTEDDFNETDDKLTSTDTKKSKAKLNNGTKTNNKPIKAGPDADSDEVEDEENVKEEEKDADVEEKKPVVVKVPGRRGRKKKEVKQEVADEEEHLGENGDEDEKGNDVTTSLKIEAISEPMPSTSNTEVKQEQTEVDMDQCRVCKSKDDLVNLFSLEDDTPISDLIMSVTNVKILERDYLPKLVCKPCVSNIKVAFELKTLCEATDNDLRSKLKRSKKTGRVGRRRGDFILVDCEISSGGSDKEEADDDEFHLSEVSDSDVSFSASGKKKKRGRRRKVTPRKKLSPKTPVSAKRRSRQPKGDDDDNEFGHEEVFVDEAPAMSDSSDDDEPISKKVKKTPGRRGRPPKSPAAKAAASARLAEAQSSSKIPHKKRSFKQESDDDVEENENRTSSATKSRKEHQCPFCDESFPTFERLREHKKKYIGLKPLTCNICQKAFKQRVSYESHIRRHQEDETRICKLCSQAFSSRMDLRRHEQSAHDLTFECDKCKRPFISRLRLERHIENKCPGFETNTPPSKRKSDADGSAPMGKDLFKCVAPLTTTYWSDSFSD